jgi:F0F1-type ATP synthase assembly protein I
VSSSWKATYRYGNIGLELFLSIVVGFLFGRWVDRHWLHGHGYGTAVGTAIGVYAGFRSVWKLAKQAQAESAAEDAAEAKKLETDLKIARYKKESEKDE